MPRIVGTGPCSGEAERLARIPRTDEIHHTAALERRERPYVIPDRRRSHEALLHRPDQVRDCEGFPLHHSDELASAAQREIHAEVESADAAAQ